jgi:hypothetical protein
VRTFEEGDRIAAAAAILEYDDPPRPPSVRRNGTAIALCFEFVAAAFLP